MHHNVWNTFDGSDANFSEEIHIFKLDTQEYLNISSSHILSKIEKIKLQRFHHQKDRENYLIRKYILRALLAFFLKRDPTNLDFSTTANKKPVLDGIFFNTSRSNDFLLIAIASVQIGIDVEHIYPKFDLTSIVSKCFDDEEASIFYNSNNDMQTFFEIWTRKEALLKATGEGLIENLKSVSVLNPIIKRHRHHFTLNTFYEDKNVISICYSLNDSLSVKFWNKIDLVIFSTF